MRRRPGLALAPVLIVLAACEPRGEAPRTAAREVAPPVAAQSAADRCEHGMPPGICPRCNPALAAVYRSKGDWCEAHGLPGSLCPQCDPDVKFPELAAPAAAAADWCGAHALPESKCTKCNPSLIEQYKAAGDWCEQHGFPESVCPVCKPARPPAGAERAALAARVVRFKTPDIEAATGIATVGVKRVAAASASVECTARLAFHGDRVAEIHAVVPGIVRKVRVELGDHVDDGSPLFDLESIHVGEIQAELQTAREGVRTATANLARRRELVANGLTSGRQVDLAEQELITAQAHANAAQAGLRLLGAGVKAGSAGRYTLVAPIAGTVVRRPVVLGILATEDTSLATIADTSVMWALCDVPESSASQISPGQTMQLAIDGDPESSFAGEITWVAAEVDPRTRTVTAQAELPNPGGKLRANQFGLARIDTSAARSAVTVPRAAVQRVGELEVVFVRTGPGVYEPRVVERVGDGEVVAVTGRLQDGDAVVTTGAVLLRTEIMPGSIGAGCCEAEAPGGR